MGFPAELGETGSSARLMDLGFGRMLQPGWRPFSEHYCAYFLVLCKGFFTKGNSIRGGKNLPLPTPPKKDIEKDQF